MPETTFDIAIIGAGIAGASLAAELSKTHRVIVFEQEEFPGYHSTGRSAALFSEIYGNRTVRALSRASRNFFYSPPADFTPEPLVKRRGSLYIARQSQIPALTSFATSEGVVEGTRVVSSEEAISLCPILKPECIARGVYEQQAADVDVYALHQGYLRQLRARGGILATNTGVRSLSQVNGDWRIAAGDGIFVARTVVNASGAWADTIAKLASATQLQIQPRRRTAILVELPVGTSPDDWPMVVDIDEAFYLKPDAGLLLISPADETLVEASDVQPEEFDVATAIDRVEQATTLKIRKLRKRWAGLRSFAPDRSPVVGFDTNVQNFFWLAAQGGYGIQTAPALSHLGAQIIRGEVTSSEFVTGDIVDELSPARFLSRSPARSFA